MPDGVVHSLPKPNRHHHLIAKLTNEGNYPTPISGEQGFINESGEFLNRLVAVVDALEANQITLSELIAPPRLYSEDVW